MLKMSAWAQPLIFHEDVSFSEIIMSEKSEKKKIEKQIKEDFNLAKQLLTVDVIDTKKINNVQPITESASSSSRSSAHITNMPCSSKTADFLDSIMIPNDNESTGTEMDDKKIAELLQAEFDMEYDEEVKRVENSRNKNSKISVSFHKYRLYPDELLQDESDKEDEDAIEQRRMKNWDRFEENEKEISKIGKSGFREINDGKTIITKHDSELTGRRNAGKVMEFHSDFECGDCGNFDMKISNKIYNELRAHSHSMAKKMNQVDRQENKKTSEMGLDQKTRLLLYKLINTTMALHSIDGIISKGKEAVVLHGEGNVENEDYPRMTKEVAIKIFSTTLNEFKQRDRYIKDDFRFKGNLKQNNRNIINMWCEKEFYNLNRLKKANIPCPCAITFKKHVLVMSYIGNGHENPAPKLKDVKLSKADMICTYEEVVEIMKIMYQKAKLVHADFSEYNILYFEGKCFIIDLATAVEPTHPSAFEFLMRDCHNITNYFEKHEVPVKTKEELFFEITQLDPLTTNTAMLEKIHMKGDAVHVVTNPRNFDDIERERVPEHHRLNEFPFDYAWNKVEEMRQKGEGNIKSNQDHVHDEWTEVSSKKKNRHKSESNEKVIDNDSANIFKEISVTMN